MTEALEAEKDFTPEALADLFRTAGEPRTRDPFAERKRSRAAKKQVVLLRVPNYFEDAALIARAGGLDEALFAENFGGVAVDEWWRWEPAIKVLQEKDPLAYVEFEKLAKKELATDPGQPPV